MQLNQFGEIVAEEWLKSVEIRQEIELDHWVIMPNHFRALVIIDRAISGRGALSFAQICGFAQIRQNSNETAIAVILGDGIQIICDAAN